MQKGSKQHRACLGILTYRSVFNESFSSRNLLFYMKCSFIALVIQLTFAGTVLSSGKASAQNLNDQISLKLRDVSLREAFKAIEQQSNVQFNAKSELLDNSEKKISLSDGHITIKEALGKILDNTGLRYRLVEGYIVIETKPLLPKHGSIAGKIVDEKGDALPGASVRIVETDAGVQSGVDGSYILNVQPGIYTLEASYISFQTQRITGVVVAEGKNTALNISLKIDSKGLNEVIVTSSYKKASTDGLLVRQKNAAEISNGISAEQISSTPDRNIGESLKRISGVSTADNKFVIVRGIGERYNAAVLDGTPLPSTEAQSRNFSFDLIPSGLVDNVVVSKTVTPDMNTSFGGGLIQVNTKDMPDENFVTFAIGSSYNSVSTGKPFFSHQRGRYDFLGFDDGRRKAPGNLVPTNPNVNQSLTPAELQKLVDDQSKRFTNDNFTLYKNNAPINQSYQFTIGQKFDVAKEAKLGFTGALTYRNGQNIENYDNFRRGNWNLAANNYGNSYTYNTTWGTLLNVGLQLGAHRLRFRNTYTRMFSNKLFRTYGYNADVPNEELPTRLPFVRENDDPTFTGLLQNKLAGQHQLGKIKLEWDAARTAVNREEKDLITAEQGPELIEGKSHYFYNPGSFSEPRTAPMSRQYYKNNEKHYTWNIAGTLPFNIGTLRNTVKIGYYGNRKRGGFDWTIASLTTNIRKLDPALKYITVAEMQKPENVGSNGYMYQIYYMDRFSGKSKIDAGYLMFDNRLADKWRLIWGLRGEYFKYTSIANPSNGSREPYTAQHDPAWRWLPSANLTYSMNSKINIRGAWSVAVVRPELLDNSQFFRYVPELDGDLTNQGITSTKITSYDLRGEWFPGLGETFSLGGFYKYFDKPVELNQTEGANTYYLLSNSDYAKVYGLEVEFRKKTDFFSQQWLQNFTLYGNLTLQRSTVQGRTRKISSTGEVTYILEKLDRPMYGQSPYLINMGLQYQGNHFGANLMYNKSGRKTYIVSSGLQTIDYEMPRSIVDAQLSYKLLKNKMQLKFNVANLFDRASTFYKNAPDSHAKTTPGYTEGKSDNYEPGERITQRTYFGRTFSFQLNYNF